MKLRGKIAAISSAAALAVSAWAIPAYATPPGESPTTENPNHPDYWEVEYPGATCYKDDSTYGDVKTDGDGKTYVELKGDYDYVSLIVKGGSSGGDGNGNAIFDDPVVGEAYYPPLNNGDQQAGVSHWIVCIGDGDEEPEYVCGWVEGEPTMLLKEDYPNLPPWQEDGDYNGCGEPEEQEYNYCDATERPAGMSIAEWLAEGEFNGADCFEFTPALQCGSFDWTIDESPEGIGPYEVRYLEGAGMTTDAVNGMMMPATFPEDYNGGSVVITVWLQGPEKDYLVGTGLPNYWDNNGRNVTIDTDCLPPSGGELPVTMDAELTGVCIGDTPWIQYDIEVNDPGEQLPVGAKATISLKDPNYPGMPTPWEVDFGMGYLLWPGAEIAPAEGLTEGDIDPTDPSTYVILNWPGWEKVGDAWAQVSPENYGWSATAAGVPYEISVNPTTMGTLFYPPAGDSDSTNCLPPDVDTTVLSSGPPTATPSYTG
ncbi:hypothetical protein [Demequina sp. NBRC 110052]|uniref:hypothetical protein n=1 Tax=Demequina sp. NBRC 110052 TaxID=1570341 RepID=UPI0009FF936E|nr:hypothetical protein [Demequina sp. NBRC 110052]